MAEIKLKDKLLNYKIVRSQRKTIGIIIKVDQELLVRAPQTTSLKNIERLLHKKTDWILRKLKKVAQIKPAPAAKKFINGEQFSYLGQKYELIIKNSSAAAKVELFSNKIIVNYPAVQQGDYQARQPIIRKILVDWYRKQAKIKIEQRILNYKDLLGVEPNRIVVKKQRKRWGSCSSKGNLNFNWKIIMAPPPIIDYLVVHELSHLVHANHSKAFWQTVASLIPEVEKKREWLRINARQLDF